MKNQNQLNLVKQLAICAGAVLAATVAAAGILGLLISKGVFELQQAVPVAVGVVNVSTMVAAYVCAKKVKRKKLFVALLMGIFIIFLLMVTKLMIASQAGIALDWRLLLLVAASVCGAMLASQKRERKR